MNHKHPICMKCQQEIQVGDEVLQCTCHQEHIEHKKCPEKKKKFPIPIPTYTFDKKGGGKAQG